MLVVPIIANANKSIGAIVLYNKISEFTDDDGYILKTMMSFCANELHEIIKNDI